MSDLSDLFDFCFIDLADRLGRLADYVAESGEHAPIKMRGQTSIITQFQDGIQREFDDLWRSLRRYAIRRENEAQLRRASPLLLNETLAFSRRVADDHARLSLFPSEWVHADIHAVIDGISRHLTWPEKTPSARVTELGTIVLHDDYDYAEVNRQRWETETGISGEGSVKEALFLLPKAEKDNPLAWVMLLHEIGHALLSDAETTQAASETISKLVPTSTWGPDAPMMWAREIAADLFAIDLAGPSYLLAFISNAIGMSTQRLGAASPTHPPPRSRIEYMLDRLGTRQLTPRAVGMQDIRGHLQRLYMRSQLDLESRAGYELHDLDMDAANEATGEAADQIVSEEAFRNLAIQPFGELDYHHSASLVERLDNRIPIAAHREYRDWSPQSVRQSRRAAAGSLSESPNHLTQILTAGIISRLRSTRQRVSQLLESEGDFAAFHDERRSFDRLVSKSMEMSLIHQFYTGGHNA